MSGMNERVVKRLKQHRERLGYTKTKLATLAGISQGFYSRIENGDVGFGPETISKLAGVLGVSMDRLYASESNVEDALLDYRLIPVLDYVQAGRWLSVRTDPSEPEMGETISTNMDCPPSTFALRVRGDSMEPAFRQGDIVVINPTIQPRPGDVVVATDSEGDATFKQYRQAELNENGQVIFELVPLNPMYPRLRSDRQKIAIVGVMIEHRSYRRP